LPHNDFELTAYLHSAVIAHGYFGARVKRECDRSFPEESSLFPETTQQYLDKLNTLPLQPHDQPHDQKRSKDNGNNQQKGSKSTAVAAAVETPTKTPTSDSSSGSNDTALMLVTQQLVNIQSEMAKMRRQQATMGATKRQPTNFSM
jgi:hypothetical protein